MPPHILRIDCPDEPGLVHKITGVSFNAGYNILNNQEFVDLEAKHFFMRTAFEGTTQPDRVVSYLQQILPAESVVKLVAAERQAIVILATTEAHCLGDLLIRYYSGELPAQIKAVVANHETGLGEILRHSVSLREPQGYRARRTRKAVDRNSRRLCALSTSCSPSTCAF